MMACTICDVEIPFAGARRLFCLECSRKRRALQLRAGVARCRAGLTRPGPVTPPGALVDATTRYEHDTAAQLFVAAHPNGGTPAEVAAALGISRQRVEVILAVAVRKLAKRGVFLGMPESAAAR